MMNKPVNNSDSQIIKYMSQFNVSEDIIYLNHAAVSPWPAATSEAVIKFAKENNTRGSFHYPEWIKNESRLRKLLAELIHAPSAEDIALVKNTSEGLSMVAYGYPWKAGDNIVIPAGEFPSNRIVWESLESKGVEIKQVAIFPTDNPEQQLIDAIDDNTRLISVSSVHYANGLKLELPVLGVYCKQHDVLFCVDAIQSIGAAKFDVGSCHADFVIADGHKWMLGPEGLGLFYSHPEARNKLQLFEYGWHMLSETQGYTADKWRIHESARRFECGSPNMLGAHALLASIQLIHDIGMDEIENKVVQNSMLMHEWIAHSKNLVCSSAQASERFAGIVSFNHRDIPSDRLYKSLMSQNIMCADRDGSVRFSPHFYTTEDSIIRALTIADAAKI